MERPYDNSRREQQAHENRGRVIDAALALLADEGSEITIPSVAKRAGVSVPTVYRNFATRDALLTAVNEELSRRLGAPEWSLDPDEWADRMPELHAWFAANEPMIRAALRARGGRDAIEHGRRMRDRDASGKLAPLVSHLPPAEGTAIFAVFRLLAGSDAWLAMVERFGLSPEVTGRAVGWALAQLVAALRDEKARGKSTLEIPKPKTPRRKT